MKIRAIVPIKLNNERFPNKNLELLDGKPLCTYLLNTLSNIDYLETYVYCSDESIIPYLPNRVKFYKRSTSLDSFQVKRQEIVSSMIKDIESDVYLYAHVTNPFLSEQTIRQTIECIIKDNYDSAIGVTKQQKYCWYDNKPINFDANNLLRTQDIKPVYIEIGLFAFKYSVAQNNGSVYGSNLKLVPVNEIEAIDIDYKEDLDFANSIIQNQRG